MTQLLVYTRSFFLRSAIDHLCGKGRIITYFSNRVQFLACATVLQDATLLIDAIHHYDGDVSWINSKLHEHRVRKKVNYLVPLHIRSNCFTSKLPLISELSHLKSLLFLTLEGCGSSKKNVHKQIINQLKKIMSDEDVFLISNFYNKNSGKCRELSKKERNKIYYIRKHKLNLSTPAEFKQFIVFLSENTD